MTQGSKCQNCRKAIKFTARADARYCSDRCRLRAHRKQQRKTATPHKAHQRIIRERLAAADPQVHPETNIASAHVRAMPLTQARELIEPYEWLGTMPPTRFAFGIFFGDRCGGAVLYGDEYAENLGVWDKYGFTGKIICLSRGACVHWAPPHAASKLIRQSMKLLPDRYKIVTATVDAAAGEIGTIYQACGFDFVGTMSAGRRTTLIRVNGSHMSERQAQRLVGTRGCPSAGAHGV